MTGIGQHLPLRGALQKVSSLYCAYTRESRNGCYVKRRSAFTEPTGTRCRSREQPAQSLQRRLLAAAAPVGPGGPEPVVAAMLVHVGGGPIPVVLVGPEPVANVSRVPAGPSSGRPSGLSGDHGGGNPHSTAHGDDTEQYNSAGYSLREPMISPVLPASAAQKQDVRTSRLQIGQIVMPGRWLLAAIFASSRRRDSTGPPLQHRQK
jgi:hypothetical protein